MAIDAGAVVRIAERTGPGNGAFAARVSFGDQTEHDLEITDPGDAESENRLAWYFEKHLRFPFLDKDLEQQAVKQITTYGRNLFAQVFGGKANHDYQSLREKSFDGCRIEIRGSASFQSLHWEALRDPDLPDPLAIRLPVTRRADAVASKFTVPTNAPVLRILVVTARPDGPADIGYRTISR
ncbi:MAG TPA: hypothetical protein VFI65_01505, partial [Streptosporangiaceae bacterium]|nr:hypothetical protein [Streptosporangiaceae bacterium]